MSSREFDEGDVMLGEEEGRGGNCSGELSIFSGRAGSVGRERRLYRPADIVDRVNKEISNQARKVLGPIT